MTMPQTKPQAIPKKSALSRLWTLFIAGVLVVALGATLIGMIDEARIRAYITAAAEQATGRALIIKGAIQVEPSLTPTIRVEDVIFRNADWAQPEAMVAVASLEIQLSLLSLLQDQVVVNRLVLDKPVVYLEQRADGLNNWTFAPAEAVPSPAESNAVDAAAPTTLPIVQQLTINNGIFVYKAADGKEERVEVASLTLTEDFRGMRLTLATKVNAASVAAEVTASNMLTFLESGEDLAATANLSLTMPDRPLIQLQAEINSLAGKPYALTLEPLKVTLADAVVTASGSVQLPVKAALAGSLKAELTAPSLATLGAPARMSGLAATPVTLQTRLAFTDTTLALSELVATVGESSLKGSAALAFLPKRLAIDEATLHFPVLRVADILAPAPAVTEAAAEAPAPDATNNKVFSQEPFDVPLFDRADDDGKGSTLTLTIDSLDPAPLATLTEPLTGIALRLTSQDKTLSSRLTVAEAPVASLSYNSASAKLTAMLNLSLPDLGSVLKQMGTTDLIQNGVTAITLEATAKGNSPHALASTANGQLVLSLDNAVVANRYIDILAADLARQALPWTASEDVTQIQCLRSTWAIQGGVATSTGTAAATRQIAALATGQVNLGQEAVDILLKPRARDRSLLSLGVPIRIEGALAAPKISLDTASAIKGVATTVILGALNPVAAAAPLVQTDSLEGEDPCAALLADTAPATAGDTATPPPPVVIPEALEKPIQQLRGILNNLIPSQPAP